MASKFEEDEQLDLLNPNGYGKGMECLKHNERIKLFCKKHSVAVCHLCAIKDHQKPCKLSDLADIIKEMELNINNWKDTVQDIQTDAAVNKARILACAAFVDTHLGLIKTEINDEFKKRINLANGKHSSETDEINQEADERILRVNKERRERLMICDNKLDQQQTAIKDSHASLAKEINTICKMVQERLTEVKKEADSLSQSLEDALMKIDLLLSGDEDLVNNSATVIQSVETTILLCSKLPVNEYLKDIADGTKCIKLLRCCVSQVHIGRIGGFQGKWKLAHKFNIPTSVRGPRIVGCTSRDEIAISDFKLTDLYEMRSTNGGFRKVITRKGVSCVISCSSLNENVTVCGKWTNGCTGGNRDADISLYNNNWRSVKSIRFKRNNSNTLTTKVSVDVDGEGNIIAAEIYQKTIHVLDPSDGTVIKTFDMEGEKTVAGAIQSLRTGDVVVRTGDAEFAVVSRSGHTTSTISNKEWTLALCAADPLTDELYVTHWSREKNCYAVDIVTRDGTIKERDIVKFDWSAPSPFMSPAIITHSGHLVCCDGNTLLVYEKIFIL